MRRLVPALLIVALAAVGCGQSTDQGKTPDSCLSGPVYFNSALEKAPGNVRLPGDTRISDCLVENQGVGDEANVGKYLIRVATSENRAARLHPAGPGALRAGYLVGAVTKGASNTGGIHDVLADRVRTAALYSPAGKPPPEPFDHQYKTGYAAGSKDG
jgi:hypothetical protein